MTLLNAADAIHMGSASPSALYLGANKIWQPPTLTMTATPVTTGEEYEHGIGSNYTSFTVTASGGTPPYVYALANNNLPAGITLNPASGVVSGVPAFETAGVYPDIRIQAIDAVGAIGKLAPFTLTILFKDPYYDSVRFLLDYDAPVNNNIFIDQKFGVMGLTGGDTKTVLGQAPYGMSSIYLDGNGDWISFADDPKWDLLAAPFTIDFTALSTLLGSTIFWLGQFGANSPNLSWVLYTGGSQVLFNVSTTGSDNIQVLASPNGALVSGVWARWRVDYDGAVYRLYKDGVMLAKTTATHTKAQVNQPLVIGANGATTSFLYQGYTRGIRLTVGAARTASDSGYQISARAFPFVQVVQINVSFDPVTANNVTLEGGNLSVTNTASGTTSQGARVADVSGRTSGKYYYEALMALWATGGVIMVGGVGTIGSSFVGIQGGGTTGITLDSQGAVWSVGNRYSAMISSGLVNGNSVGFAVDLDNRLFWVRLLPSGIWNNSGTANPATGVGGLPIPAGTMVPFCTFGGVSTGPGNKVISNFGASPFLGAVPSGFAAGWLRSDLAPVNTVLPVISGAIASGHTLATTNGTWSMVPSSYAYQWRRNGVAISGATASTYALVSADIGTMITVAVIGTNSIGSTTVVSMGVGPIWTNAVAWLPSQLTTLKVWLKGDTLTGATGDPVGTWPDASGAGNNATVTGTNRPLLQLAHQNGLNVLNFVASSQNYYNLPNAFGAFTEAAQIFVLKLKNSPGANATVDGPPSRLGSHSGNSHYGWNGDGLVYDAFATTVRLSTGYNPGAAYHVGGMRSKAADWRYYTNGTLRYSTTTNAVGWLSAPTIGVSQIATFNYIDCYYAEYILLNEFASTADWQKLEGYLANKWGTQGDLPSAHPYKVNPPYIYS